MGFDVDCINTITLSNHPAYAKGTKGQSLDLDVLQQILQGLEDNQLLGYNVVMTGYTRFAAHLNVIAKGIEQIRSSNPAAIYVCDPVLGDNEQYYVPEELTQKYQTLLFPLATVITPNIFESQVLTGMKINSLADGIEAAKKLHHFGPKIVMMTGLPIGKNDVSPHLVMLLSYKSSVDAEPIIFRVDVPKLEGYYAGCGDLFSALLTSSLAHLMSSIERNPFVLGSVLEWAAQAMSEVLLTTKRLQSRELCIVESRDTFVKLQGRLKSISEPDMSPRLEFSDEATSEQAVLVQHPAVLGVIFDMDGTLTLPGAIDFKAMYRRIGLQRHKDKDLLTLVGELPEAERARAMQIIYEEEMAGINRQEMRSGLVQTISSLHASKVRLALCTRNCRDAYLQFLQQSSLLAHHFLPALFRESFEDAGIQKPNPELARHILRTWEILPEQYRSVWFVGDSLDDMKCGKLAGLTTCLIRTHENEGLEEQFPELIDHTVAHLEDLVKLLDVPPFPGMTKQ